MRLNFIILFGVTFYTFYGVYIFGVTFYTLYGVYI